MLITYENNKKGDCTLGIDVYSEIENRYKNCNEFVSFKFIYVVHDNSEPKRYIDNA